MTETFLILLAGGIMFAAAAPKPQSVTLQWLRLAGILALSFAGVSIVFEIFKNSPRSALLWIAYALTVAMILAQLAFSQTARLAPQRLAALAAFVAAMATAQLLEPSRHAILLLSAAGVSILCGLVLMEMLLGHAYLTASKMTMEPMQRMNRLLAWAIFLRAVMAVGAAVILQLWRPVEMLWVRYGLQIGTRWLVGLAIPAVFVYMIHDCIKRRATQSATGILYVAGVLVLVGELIGLFLARETGLPF